MKNLITSWADDRGYRVAIGRVSMLENIRNEFDSMLSDESLDASFYKSQLDWFHYPLKTTIDHPESIIIIAIPRPAHQISFEMGDKTIETIAPPTYVDYDRIRTEALKDFTTQCMKSTHDVEILRAPLKAAAARLGLVSYGRNNIAYIPGIGSYFQLVGILTDTVFPDECYNEPREPQTFLECDSCTRCITACPTGAITKDRFLLDHNRCFTLYNEYPNPLPDWLTTKQLKRLSKDSCLIGCLICQRVCPINIGFPLVEDSGIVFSAEETDALLNDQIDVQNALDKTIVQKLEQIDMVDDLPVLGRNLRTILEHQTQPSSLAGPTTA